jgi:hypothetical protein
MSTHSNIILKTAAGFRSAYCHFDGDPSCVGVTLSRHYRAAEKIESLIALGEISVLGPSLAATETFRDATPPMESGTLEGIVRLGRDRQSMFAYLFADGRWSCCRCDARASDWMPLAEAMCNPDAPRLPG